MEVAARTGQQSLSSLIDTGASVSIIPPNFCNQSLMESSPVQISAANGQTLKVYGQIPLLFTLSKLRREFLWTFVVADVTKALLGADFLSHFHLWVNCKSGTLTDENTRLQTQTRTTIIHSNHKINHIDVICLLFLVHFIHCLFLPSSILSH